MCQRLTYEEFVQKLRKWIIKDAHLPEDYVFFKKKEKTGITANGDRLFVVCAETDSGKDICGIFVEELYQDYVTGARMRGIKERVILWRHVLPNVMLPLVTLLGLSLGSLLGGTAVVEIIYNWPGMGNMAVKAISCRDYPLVQGYVLWIAILYMCINLLVDLSYTYLDPRLKEDR